RDPRRWRIILAVFDALTHRVIAGEVHPGHSLVYDCHRPRMGSVRLFEKASRSELHAHGLHVTGTDDPIICVVGQGVGRSRPAFNHEAAAAALPDEWQGAGEPHARYTG